MHADETAPGTLAAVHGVMTRLFLLIAAAVCVSRVSEAQSAGSAALKASSEDDMAWSEEHTVKAGRSHIEPFLQRSSWTGDRLALLGHLGIGAPAGELGVDVDVAPVTFFAFDVGTGLGLSGWQFAATPRFRIRSSPSSFFTLGSGLSFGAYDNSHSMAGLVCVFLCIMEGTGDSSGSIASQHYDRALWSNVELGADIYSRQGRGMMRLVLGYGQILNNSAYSCSEDPKQYYARSNGCDRTSGQGLLFAEIAGGFDL